MRVHEKAWVISVLMGLGHLRAAYPLHEIACEDIVFYGSRRLTPPREYRIWKLLTRVYYAFSQAGKIPIIGRIILALMLAIQRIQPYYPKSDQSKPTVAVKCLKHMIRSHGLCAALRDMLESRSIPAVHTFYATAIALDSMDAARDNYLVICDADFNRVWVPENPTTSRIKYLAPCTQVKRRLQAYGIRAEAIYVTGFPLPVENIGSQRGLEILKEDLFRRLLRLDPMNKFFAYHQKSVLGWLDQNEIPAQRDDFFHVTFAIGGAGAQVEMVEKILLSLREPILSGRVRLSLSCGIQRTVFERVLRYINRLEISSLLDQGLFIIYDQDVFRYLAAFNSRLRETDVLWTKPSELAFYCGLGIPILMASPIGTHEELNKRWLQEIHAGVEQQGPIEYCWEWLGDLRENGRLAEAAWDGFLKARKLGTYKIKELVLKGSFSEGRTPLEQ